MTKDIFNCIYNYLSSVRFRFSWICRFSQGGSFGIACISIAGFPLRVPENIASVVVQTRSTTQTGPMVIQVKNGQWSSCYHLHQIPQALLSSLLVVITEESLASHPTNGQGHKRRSTNMVREKKEMTAATYVSYIIPYRRVQGQK